MDNHSFQMLDLRSTKFDVKKTAVSIVSKKYQIISKEVKNNDITNDEATNIMYNFMIRNIKIAERKIRELEIPPPYTREEVFEF